MKQKRFFGIFMILLLIICLLSGCGGSSSVSDSYVGEEQQAADKKEEKAPESTTISEEALALAEKMPAASSKQLPDWRGYTLTDRYWTKDYDVPEYEEEEIGVLAELGFNFVRAPLHLESVFEDGDPNTINTDFLRSMDRLLEYCAQEKIHVCFDLHDMPGFQTNADDSPNILFTDAETQELFVAFWRFLAGWYQKVPSSLLSFNLLNEPHPAEGEELTDEVYSALMLRAVDAVRESSPDRLIFVDMLDIPMGIPVRGLADADIVQTVHAYFLEDDTEHWPVYAIDGFVDQDSGILTLKGQFPAGTQISFTFDSVHLQSRFELAADDKTLADLELGGDAVGEDGCVEIGEENTEGEWRRYDNAVLSATLPQDCTKIELHQDGGWWYMLRNIAVSTDKYEQRIGCGEEGLSGKAPVLVFDEAGNITEENDGVLGGRSKEWLENRFSAYQSFTEETGTLVMVQEFGFNRTLAHDVVLSSAEDFLSVLDKYDIPWCSWNGDFGPLIDTRDNEATMQRTGIPVLHEDAEYETVSEYWFLDRELMKVFQAHIN